MSQHTSTTANLVGIHYRVGRKIGEGSFGVIFEGPLSFVFLLPIFVYLFLSCCCSAGTNLLNSQTVAIKFVRCSQHPTASYT